MRITPININIQPFVQRLKLSDKHAELLALALLKGITDEVYSNWQRAVSAELKSTRQEYLNGIQIYKSGEFENTLALTGTLPKMLENGAAAFDLKVGLLQSSKAKIGKNGKIYITVPFRHASSGAIGENPVFSNVMPRSVHALAKNLKATLSQVGGGVAYGGALQESSIPSPHNQRRIRATIVKNTGGLTESQLTEYRHKNSIYANMYRNEKTYEKATQNSYVTFRRVSEKSDTNAWIHKGLERRDFIGKALKTANIKGIITQIRNEFINGIKNG